MAGAIQQKSSSHPVMRAWYTYAHCPFRLFTLAALIHTLVMFGLVMLDAFPLLELTLARLVFISLFGLLATPVLGALLFWMPQRFNQSAISYGWYSFACLMILISLAIMEAGLFYGPVWTGIGTLGLIIAWTMSLNVLKNLSIWVNTSDKPWLKMVLFGLYAMLFGGVIFCLGSFMQSYVMTLVIPLVAFLLSAVSILAGSIMLQARKADIKMSCSIN